MSRYPPVPRQCYVAVMPPTIEDMEKRHDVDKSDFDDVGPDIGLMVHGREPANQWGAARQSSTEVPMLKSGYASQILVSVAAAALVVFFAGAAVALSTGDYIGKTEAEITESLKKQGYEIREVEREGDILEAEIVRDGKQWEISADSRTGKVVEMNEENEENEGSFIRRLFGIGK